MAKHWLAPNPTGRLLTTTLATLEVRFVLFAAPTSACHSAAWDYPALPFLQAPSNHAEPPCMQQRPALHLCCHLAFYGLRITAVHRCARGEQSTSGGWLHIRACAEPHHRRADVQYMYWGHTASQEGAAKVCDEMSLSAANVYGREKADIVVQLQSHLLQQVHERSQSAVYRHKWACKVDWEVQVLWTERTAGLLSANGRIKVTGPSLNSRKDHTPILPACPLQQASLIQ